MGYTTSRRAFLLRSGSAFLGAALFPGRWPHLLTGRLRTRLVFYAGTYTDAGGKGIYRCELPDGDGPILLEAVATDIKNPSFVLLDAGRRFLYAVSETDENAGRPTGGVYAYAVEPATGKLTLINHRSSEGAGPCHLALDRTGRFLLVANYTSGSVALFPRGTDGAIGPVSNVIQHHGSGPVKDRQQSPHAHCVGLDPLNRLVLVADLGMDKVMVYSFDTVKGTLTPADQPFLALAPGSGPRHFAFHPDGRMICIISELKSTVTTATYDGVKGEFQIIQVLSTLPPAFSGESAAAEVCVAPSGRFVYCSNRGHNSIAVFSVHPDTGVLRLVQHQTSMVNWPRNFVVDPAGDRMLVANQHADSVTSFHIDEADGTLTPGTGSIAIPSPVCLAIVPHE